MSSSRTPSGDPRNRRQIDDDVAHRAGEPDFTAATHNLGLCSRRSLLIVGSISRSWACRERSALTFERFPAQNRMLRQGRTANAYSAFQKRTVERPYGPRQRQHSDCKCGTDGGTIIFCHFGLVAETAKSSDFIDFKVVAGGGLEPPTSGL